MNKNIELRILLFNQIFLRTSENSPDETEEKFGKARADKGRRSRKLRSEKRTRKDIEESFSDCENGAFFFNEKYCDIRILSGH